MHVEVETWMQNWGPCTDFTDKHGIKVTEHSEELHAGQDKICFARSCSRTFDAKVSTLMQWVYALTSETKMFRIYTLKVPQVYFF